MPLQAKPHRAPPKRPGGRTPFASRVRLARPDWLPFVLQEWQNRGVTLSEMERQTDIRRPTLRRYLSGATDSIPNPFPQKHLDALVNCLPPDLGHVALMGSASWARIAVRVYLEQVIDKRLAAYRESGVLDACRALCVELLEHKTPPYRLRHFLKRASELGWCLPGWIPERYRPGAQQQTSDQVLIFRDRGTPQRIELALCRALEPFLDADLGRGLFPAENVWAFRGDRVRGLVERGGDALKRLNKQLDRELDLLPRRPAEEAAGIVAEIMAGGTPAGVDTYLVEMTRQNLKQEGLGPGDRCPCPFCLEISEDPTTEGTPPRSRQVQQLLEKMPAEIRWGAGVATAPDSSGVPLEVT